MSEQAERDAPPVVPPHQHGPFHVRVATSDEQVVIVRWCAQCGTTWTMSQAVNILDGETRYHFWSEVREAPEHVEEQ